MVDVNPGNQAGVKEASMAKSKDKPGKEKKKPKKDKDDKKAMPFKKK